MGRRLMRCSAISKAFSISVALGVRCKMSNGARGAPLLLDTHSAGFATVKQHFQRGICQDTYQLRIRGSHVRLTIIHGFTRANSLLELTVGLQQALCFSHAEHSTEQSQSDWHFVESSP